MKKAISILLVLVMIVSTVTVTCAEELEYGNIIAYGTLATSDDKIISFSPLQMDSFDSIEYAQEYTDIECIQNKEQLMNLSDEANVIEEESDSIISAYSSTDFTFDADVLISFNTITGPIAGNGANEPKFSYNSFLEENISDYSGELTLNFKDLVLEGKNGLDLRIGRTYQTVASNMGEKSVLILPDDNGYLKTALVNDYSTYLLDRYNLGVGWGFNFPSVQVETEYIPQEIEDSYFFYETETELYYHWGDGNVHQVQFTPDTSDSNLKGYYKKDIQFNKEDRGYSNGTVTSYYSMTLPDKTKQYFAEDGRLLGMVDRFGNTIKFEHELQSVTNRVPDGNFRYDDDMWITSTSSSGSHDVLQMEDTIPGSDDGYVMYFRRNNANKDTYIMSRPIRVKPDSTYKLGIRLLNENEPEINVEVIQYDTAYNVLPPDTSFTIDDYGSQWYDFNEEFEVSNATRYIAIKISSSNAKYTYIDSVTLDEPKPLIKKITDSVGRIITFDYTGDFSSGGDSQGAVTVTVTSPDGSSVKTLSYNKQVTEFVTKYAGHTEQRLFWYLQSSNTEGEDGSDVKYFYSGGVVTGSDGDKTYPILYSKHNSKIYSSSDVGYQRPVLDGVRYKDRIKSYEYEVVRKHLGNAGYYDTLRVNKKYDKYAYVPDGTNKMVFKGELNVANYSYSGTYNGNGFDNETGYPNYKFDDTTELNELWTVTKAGQKTDTVTYSNCLPVSQTSSDNNTAVVSEYTYHNVFKDLPIQIKNTVTQNDESKTTYKLYTYNEWGGVESESKEIDEAIKNDEELIPKYTTIYQYNPEYHLISGKYYYYNVDKPQVSETYKFNSDGLVVAYKNSVGKTTQYYYENSEYPFLVTKSVTDDPMGFHNLLGGDKVTEYVYDSYGLYPVSVLEHYENKVSSTSYEYDYITGDVLKETFPDSSTKIYEYYSDGKIKAEYLTCEVYSDGRTFYKVNLHTYYKNAMCTGYSSETPVCTIDQIQYCKVFVGENQLLLYGAEQNYYDAAGNIKVNYKYDLSKTDENGYNIKYETKYYYDTNDRLIKTTDCDGNSVLYGYDGFDRPVSVTDSENNVYYYEYNSVQNKVDLIFDGNTETENRHLMTQYFDLYGNVIKNQVYPYNSEDSLYETYKYDLNNNLTEYKNANGEKTEYFYDSENRLRETLLPDGVKATSNYSVFNEPSFEKIFDYDGTELYTRITYRNEKGDVTGKLFNYNRKLVNADNYTVDEKGRTTWISEGENEKYILYDECNHPIIVSDGEHNIHRRYNQYGEVLSVSDDENIPEIQYDYDTFGNVNGKLQNGKYLIGYTYSPSGNLVQSSMPSGRTESYTYTPNGNLDTITSEGKTFDYDYYDTGYIKSITYPNGLKTGYEYDNINRVTKITTALNGTTITEEEYTYDNNGNIVEVIKNGEYETYTYDALDRLISVTYTDGSCVDYEYDALNNRIKEIYSNGSVKFYVYNEKNQLERITLNNETTDTFTYNETGAVVTHNDKTFIYDEWDRMSGYTDGTESYTYRYDANGIRTGKNDKQYIIDINNSVVAETDSTGAITDEVLWGHQPLARKTNGSWYYYIYNAHGDVIGLVDDAGTVVNTYEYTPWGEILSETETVENPIKYAGEYYDDELDMIYLRARYYNPQIGRFTSLDVEEGEISNPLDMNRYVYCRNNPIKYVDPTGKDALAASAVAALLYKAAPYIVAGITAVVGVGIMYYKEHTKGARGSTHDKHTKKRSGAPSKASKKPGWKDRSNKKKPK